MVHSGVDDGLAGLCEIVDVIHVVEIAVPCGAVPRHELGLQVESIEFLGGEGHARNRPGENLQIDVRSDSFPHTVHALEGVFTNIEKRRLIPRAASELEVPDPGLLG